MGETNDTGTTGTGAVNAVGASSVIPPTTPPAPVQPPPEEPRILEEHIVTPAPARIPETPPQIQAPRPTSVPSALPTEPLVRANIAPTPPTPEITQLVRDVKLPERAGGEAQKTPRTYDTSLAGPTKEEQATREARVREAARSINESLPTKVATSADDIRPIHTLKEDLQDVVRTKKISMVRAVALEEEKRHRSEIGPDGQTPRASRTRPLFVLALTLVLFFSGVGALAGAYLVIQGRTVPTASYDQILFAEQTVPFPVESFPPIDLRREIASARNAGGLTLGSILQIIPMKHATEEGASQERPLTLGEFLGAIGARPPEELSRALGSNFFFGFHAVDENAPVMVVSVSSYERAFAAMLEWEETMNEDLAPMFTAVSRQTIDSGVPIERTFEDTVIRNYDVRALKDESGQIQLYYSFPTRHVLILAESPYSFAELLSRLRADRRL